MSQVTQAELARALGVAKSTVTKYKKAGRIRFDEHGLIDLDTARAQILDTESPLPHHQARKRQWEILRGMSQEEIKAYHADVKARRMAIRAQTKAIEAELRLERKKFAEKARRASPNYRKHANAYQKRISEQLTDSFITKILGKEFSTPELIEIKRQQLAIKRAMHEFNAAIHNEKEKYHE
jgi:DNA-binding transcriptional MerR regulator